MARALTLSLDDVTADRLTDNASAAGLTPEALAAEIIERSLEPRWVREDAAAFQPVQDWTEADRRLAEYDRTGNYVDAATALDTFVAQVDSRADARE